MRFFLLFAYITAFVWLISAEAQQNINSLTTKDIKVNGNLEVNSTSLASKPCPVMSEVQRDAIASPQSGRCVYNSNTNQLNIFNGTIWKSAGGGISNWETAFNYAINDVVIESNKIYQCNTAHTSTVFASDIANWTQIANNVSDASGVLPMTNGGTDKNLTPTLGGVVYTDANSMEVLAAGTSGQVLKSNGAAAPTWQDASNKLQGQDQTEVNFTKLKVPKRSATPTASGEYLLEAGDNLLYNGGFEATPDLDGWTCVGAGSSFTIESKPVSASVVISGDKTLAIGCATVGGCTCTQDFSVNQQQAGRSVLLSGIVRTSSDVQGLKLTYRENGADTSITTQNVLNGIPATEAVIGSSATTIGIKLTIPYNSTPTIVRVDEIKMAYGTAVTNQPAIGPWSTFSPSGTWTTNTAYVGKFRQVGSSAEISITANISGTPNSANLEFNIPSGLTIDSSQISSATNFYTLGTCSTKSATILYPCYVMYKSATSVSVHVFRASSAQNHDPSPISPTVPNAFINGDSVSVLISVPIAQYASSIPTYTGRCSNKRNCKTIFTAVVDNSCNITGNDFGFFSGCSGTATKTLNFYKTLSNVPNCGASAIGGTGSTTANVSSITTSAFSTTSYTGATGNASGVTVWCELTGKDFEDAFTLQQNVALKNYVKSEGSTSPEMQMVRFGSGGDCSSICTTGTCTICKRIGTLITSVTHTGTTGTYNLNGIDGTKWMCLGSGIEVGVAYTSVFHDLANSTTSLARILMGKGSTNANTGATNVWCYKTDN